MDFFSLKKFHCTPKPAAQNWLSEIEMKSVHKVPYQFVVASNPHAHQPSKCFTWPSGKITRRPPSRKRISFRPSVKWRSTC